MPFPPKGIFPGKGIFDKNFMKKLPKMPFGGAGSCKMADTGCRHSVLANYLTLFSEIYCTAVSEDSMEMILLVYPKKSTTIFLVTASTSSHVKP